MERWWASLLGKHPLAVVALVAAGGILVSDGQPTLIAPFGISAAVFLLVALVKGGAAMLLAGAFCVFGCCHAVRWEQTFQHPLLTSPAAETTEAVRVFGHFISAPMEGHDKQVEVIFAADQVDFMTRTISVRGLTCLQLSGRIFKEGLAIHGGRYELKGKLRVPVKPINPTTFDRFAMAVREGVVGNMAVGSCSEADRAQFSLGLAMLRGAELSRQWIARQLSLGIEDDEDAVTLIRTMALGTAEKDTEHLEEPFRNSGTLHVFAVSGLHVGLIGVIGWVTLKMLGFRKTYALCILIPLVFGYAYVTGWRPSAARAAFMMAMMALSPLANRRGRIVNALGFSALWLWAFDTQQIYQAGFQLSFLVLLAIAMASHAMAQPFLPWARVNEYLPEQLASWRQRAGAVIREFLVMLGATSLAAWIGSTPLMLAHFGSFTPVALLANLLLVPLSFLSLSCVALSLMAAIVGLTSVQTMLNNTNMLLAHAMVASADGFSRIPGGNVSLDVPEPSPDSPPELLIPALPPGQSCQLLVTQGQGWWLDCGGPKSYDRVLLPMIQASGVKRFGGMVLSHSDVDHLGAGMRIFKRFDIPQLLLPLHEPWLLDSRATTMWELVASPLASGTAIRHFGAGQSVPLSGQVTMKVLYPSATDNNDKADDRVMVARLSIGNTQVLWCSDAGFIAEKAVLKRFKPEDLKSDVLIRGQHSGDFTALPEFLSAVAPRIVVTSHFPAVPGEAMPQHLADYCTEHEVALVDLQTDGFTTLRFPPRVVEVNTYASGKSFTISR